MDNKKQISKHIILIPRAKDEFPNFFINTFCVRDRVIDNLETVSLSALAPSFTNQMPQNDCPNQGNHRSPCLSCGTWIGSNVIAQHVRSELNTELYI